jgi:hypothetical protein
MRRYSEMLLGCCLLVIVHGCNFAEQPTTPVAKAIRAEDLVGKWRMVRADGQPLAQFDMKSLKIDIAADGAWTSEIEMQGQWTGMSMKGGGKWSLADGVVSYTSGANSGMSRVTLKQERLIFDPDFTVRKDGKTEVAGEYER